jgi:hypothetical protein
LQGAIHVPEDGLQSRDTVAPKNVGLFSGHQENPDRTVCGRLRRDASNSRNARVGSRG